MVIEFIAVALLGYLLGSIPCGVIVTRLMRGTDVREHGSGKTGATNVLRTVGVKAGSITLICDVGKAAVAVWLGGLIMATGTACVSGMEIDSHSGAQALAGIMVIAGHSWPVFLKFRGGRGVGAFFGGFLVIYWPVALGSGLVLLAVAILSRYVSLGSITGMLISFIAMLVLLLVGWISQWEYVAYAGVAAIIIIFQHRDNIQRLLAGEEHKLGEKAE